MPGLYIFTFRYTNRKRLILAVPSCCKPWFPVISSLKELSPSAQPNTSAVENSYWFADGFVQGWRVLFHQIVPFEGQKMVKPGKLVIGGTMKRMHDFFPVTLGVCHLRNVTKQVPHVGKSHQKPPKHHKVIKVGKDLLDHWVKHVAMVEFTTLLPTVSKASVRPVLQTQWAIIGPFKSSCCHIQVYLINLVGISPLFANVYL